MFRISLLLWLIAIAALNLTLLKYCEFVVQFSPKFAGLIGLMPLFDLFVLSLYLALTRRFRIALVRRQVRRSFLDSAAMSSGAILVLETLLCLLFPEVVLQLLELLYTPVDQWIGVSKSLPETRGFLIGAILGLLMSGPPIFFTLVLSALHSRYRLEITRRKPSRNDQAGGTGKEKAPDDAGALSAQFHVDVSDQCSLPPRWPVR